MSNTYVVIGAQYAYDQREILGTFRTRTEAERYIDSINARHWAWVEVK
jgi:hypothetical protein